MFNGIKLFRLPSWSSWTKYWEQFYKQNKAKNQPRKSNGMKSGWKTNFKQKKLSNSDCRYWPSFLFSLIFLLLSTSIIIKINYLIQSKTGILKIKFTFSNFFIYQSTEHKFLMECCMKSLWEFCNHGSWPKKNVRFLSNLKLFWCSNSVFLNLFKAATPFYSEFLFATHKIITDGLKKLH